MNRSSIVVKLGRGIQNIPLSPFRIIEKPLLMFKNMQNSTPKLIILLALPRSGSTLTYQTLCHSINSNYLSNVGNLFYHLPYISNALNCKKYFSDFSSEHGFISGLNSPAEGLKFWSYWLGNHIDERKVISGFNQNRLDYLIKVVSALSGPSRPFITGYLGHILNVNYLETIFPEAIFVRLHRNKINIAKSILKIRKESTGDGWFSTFPKECIPYINSSLHEQIAAQVFWINKRLESTPSKRTIHVNYETLCKKPKSTVESIISFANNNGYNLEYSNKLPSYFKLSYPFPNKDDQKFEDLFNKLENKHGRLRSYSVL